MRERILAIKNDLLVALKVSQEVTVDYSFRTVAQEDLKIRFYLDPNIEVMLEGGRG
jgi:hypothetical protein